MLLRVLVVSAVLESVGAVPGLDSFATNHEELYACTERERESRDRTTVVHGPIPERKTLSGKTVPFTYSYPAAKYLTLPSKP